MDKFFQNGVRNLITDKELSAVLRPYLEPFTYLQTVRHIKYFPISEKIGLVIIFNKAVVTSTPGLAPSYVVLQQKQEREKLIHCSAFLTLQLQTLNH